MASDWRAMQHDTAVAVHGLLSTVDHLDGLHRQNPRVVAAEREDIQTAIVRLQRLMIEIKRDAA